MRTSVVTRLMRNVIGTMSPCHSPVQKPAGVAPCTLYLEPGPATARKLGIGHLGSCAVVTASLIERHRSAGARLFVRHRGRECGRELTATTRPTTPLPFSPWPSDRRLRRASSL